MFCARPSCRKCARSATLHRGAVRNSLPVADPCSNLSARPAPMSWSNRSEYKNTGDAFPGPGSEGVWHVAHPVAANTSAPGDVLQARVGVGGSIVLRNATSDVSGAESASGLRIEAVQPLTRSIGASGLVIP